ncbi:glutamine ABC transporter permease [Paenibacillus sp. J31TS4]|uniref:amino acid ABC transporter permease n=1 Tax=Paenibacillus sp. J31TS4 TaxID=2807195 RepID=UPI001B115D9A|nr:amino acid ABC transporter permease [Paenibacillus sp. J31TS4]GIP40892.1 glutamine ABC transporter permease [Paenibacillus sp. J31TS4]
MLDLSIVTGHWDLFLQGLMHTVLASVLALVGSFLLGTLVAVLRLAPILACRWVGTAFVEFFRNIPLLLVVYLFYLGVTSLGVPLDGFQAGTLGLTIYTAAYIAEAVRAGIQSIPRGQTEAARASGLTYGQAMRLVVLPQALTVVIPPLCNQFLNLIKNSSVLGVVAGLDLMYFGDKVESITLATFDTYIFVGLLYLLLTLPLSYASRALERRLGQSR